VQVPLETIKEGLLLVNKPKGRSSFSLIPLLRKKLDLKKIGHAGTLDPFATGLLIFLVGKNYTRRSDSLLCQSKEYIAEVKFGETTDTYDLEGKITATSDRIPSLDQIEVALHSFQGEVMQIPPMFSAKKIGGKKLYDLARKGEEIERKPVKVVMQIDLIDYQAPYLKIRVKASKGTYIRSLAYDLGEKLGCGAHLTALERTVSGEYSLTAAIDGSMLAEMDCAEICGHLIRF
jgi:tRNA pseudouridine55 synthase